MNSKIFCVFLALYRVVDGRLGSCVPAKGIRRRCISINECQPLAAIVSKPTRTQQDTELLKSSHCGFKEDLPAVCCPWTSGDMCYTPEGKSGKCVGLKSCRNLQRLLLPPLNDKKINYVERSKCDGPDQYSVCCGSTPDLNNIEIGRCTSKMNAFPPDPATQCCGIDNTLRNKIYGGSSTTIDQYPWMALIEYQNDAEVLILCNGALISGKYVLTTATCVIGPVFKKGIPKLIRLGEYDTSQEGPDCNKVSSGGIDCTDGVTRIPIQKIIPHPDHISALYNHDIALVRMTQIAPFTDFIRPICLPRSNMTRRTAPFLVTMAGWGTIGKEPENNSIKQHVDLPFINRAECQRMYEVFSRSVVLSKGHICAGGVKGKDSCTGDIGGPLMYKKDGTYEAIGLASFGPLKCGQANIPAVYTNVYEYLPWIRSTIVP